MCDCSDECENAKSTAHVPGGYLKELKKKEKHVKFGPKQKAMMAQFIPGALIYGLASIMTLAYFIDWKNIFPKMASRFAPVPGSVECPDETIEEQQEEKSNKRDCKKEMEEKAEIEAKEEETQENKEK